MGKRNCWQAMGCGREVGGRNVELLGVCPAATRSSVHGINDGHNGGRVCWAIAGTLCGGEVQGSYAAKVHDCMTCRFFREVMIHEGAAFQTGPAVQELLA